MIPGPKTFVIGMAKLMRIGTECRTPRQNLERNFKVSRHGPQDRGAS